MPYIQAAFISIKLWLAVVSLSRNMDMTDATHQGYLPQ